MRLSEFNSPAPDLSSLPQPYYEHAGITIYHGDSLRVLRELPSETVDAVITDPPYSSGGMTRGDRMQSTRAKYQQTEVAKWSTLPDFTGDTRDQRAYGYWCSQWLAESWRIAKAGAVCCLFTDWRQLPVTSDAMQAGGWVWRGIVVWDKTGAVRPQTGRFASQAEYVAWGSKGPLAEDRGVGCLPGVFTHPPLYEGRDEKQHMAAKPIPIMSAICRICPPGGVILDPFMGSGSTLRAAKNLSYSVIGIEIEERYCEIAAKRLQQEVLL
jgi:site-specific DNA-methyltransferase (adenine-specific)